MSEIDQNPPEWSVADAGDNNTVLDIQLSGDRFELSMIEMDDNAMVLDLSVTREQMRQFAHWVLQHA